MIWPFFEASIGIIWYNRILGYIVVFWFILILDGPWYPVPTHRVLSSKSKNQSSELKTRVSPHHSTDVSHTHWGFPKIVKSQVMNLTGFSIPNHPFWDTPILGNPYIAKVESSPKMGIKAATAGWANISSPTILQADLVPRRGVFSGSSPKASGVATSNDQIHFQQQVGSRRVEKEPSTKVDFVRYF